MLCLATYVSGFAATKTTVYYSVPAATVGDYTVKLNVNRKGDGDDWQQYNMTLTDKTYFGNLIYTYTFTDLHDGVGKMQFQLYNGEKHISQIEAYSSWTAVGTYNGKMYDHTYGWKAYNYDKTVIIHALKTSGWTPNNVHNYFNNGSSDEEEANFPGNATTQSTLNSDWYDYTITGRPCTRVIVSNGNSGEGNQSGTITIGDESEYWVTYDGTNTTSVTEVPADYNYTRSDLGNGKFGTLCLPYAATVEGATVYEITSKVMDGTTLTGLNLTSVTNLAAGTPYIFKASGSSFTATLSGNYTEAVTANGMVGNLSSTPINVTTGYVVSGNQVCPVGNNVTVGQYRAYITLDGLEGIGAAASRGANFIGFEEATGIENILSESSQNAVYNLQGQRVTEDQKGLVIMGGKKMLRK